MTCFKPMTAWPSAQVNPSGKRSLVFNPRLSRPGSQPMQIGCKQCIGCRLLRSAQWGIRCCHESQLYTRDGISYNCFITLTYNDQMLNKREHPWGLDVRDIQLFMKRFRRRYPGVLVVDNADSARPIRMLHCGEYGECCRTCGIPEFEHRISKDACDSYQLGRPHYHLCVFNYKFFDLEYLKTHNGHRYYTSATLQDLWSCPYTKKPYGFVVIGDLEFASAAYVSRYCLKKINGDQKTERYFDPDKIDTETGEFDLRKHEYATMSTKPGVGKRWFEKYWRDVYPHDYVMSPDGRKFLPPPYYDRLLELKDPAMLEQVKLRRVESANDRKFDLSPERLLAREQVKYAQIDHLVRNL